MPQLKQVKGARAEFSLKLPPDMSNALAAKRKLSHFPPLFYNFCFLFVLATQMFI
jgi:hypothetical protein